MTDVGCHIIDLDRSADRFVQARAMSAKLGLSFERISAADGHLLDLEATADYSQARTKSFFAHEQSAGEATHFLFHIKALHKSLKPPQSVHRFWRAIFRFILMGFRLRCLLSTSGGLPSA